MKYAVIRIKGHQYKVSEGEEILVDKTSDLKSEVLLLVNDKKVSVGTPVVTGATVSLKLVGEEKGDKINGFKYKAKSRWRRKYGHRAQLTRVLVEKISS